MSTSTAAGQKVPETIYQGPGMTVPPTQESADTNGISALARTLLHGGPISKKMANKTLIKAICLTQNDRLLSRFRDELQKEFEHLYTHPPTNAGEEVVWRGFLGNLLAILPYTYPKTSDTIYIPILENQRVTLVNYSIEVIDLEFHPHSSKMTALALTAVDGANAPPLLSFIGTTYPGGKGFLSTVLADFTPGHDVGEKVYKTNLQTMQQWFEGKTNVHAFGTSLGGAMAMHAYRHHADQLASVNVFNPPGIKLRHWQNHANTYPNPNCALNIYMQPKDLVTCVGFWPTTKNVSIYFAKSDQKGFIHNILLGHASAFTGREKIAITKLDPNILNKSKFRRFLTWTHRRFGPIFIWYPIMGFIALRNLVRKQRARKTSVPNIV